MSTHEEEHDTRLVAPGNSSSSPIADIPQWKKELIQRKKKAFQGNGATHNATGRTLSSNAGKWKNARPALFIQFL